MYIQNYFTVIHKSLIGNFHKLAMGTEFRRIITIFSKSTIAVIENKTELFELDRK